MIKSNRGRGYFLTDIGRVFIKKETYMGIIGVTVALFFSISGNIQTTVISNFLYGTYGVGFLLAFVFCAFSYGTVYSDELENGYIRYSVIRGGLKHYVISKAATIFLSSVVVMAAGGGVFGILCSLHMPWADVQICKELAASGGYVWLIKEKRYVLWLVSYGLQWGMLAGSLSQAAAFASLYITNRLLVLSVPVFCYQAITEFSAKLTEKNSMWSIQSVFDARYQMFGDDRKMFLWALGLSLCTTMALCGISYIRLKKRI